MNTIGNSNPFAECMVINVTPLSICASSISATSDKSVKKLINDCSSKGVSFHSL